MKRSAQVALVLMGATAVGASSYAMAPRTDCAQPNNPASRPPVAGSPVPPQSNEPCRQSRRWGSSSGGYSGSSGSSGWRRSTQVNTSSPLHSSGGSIAATGHASTSTAVARGGFGSAGHGYSSGS
jgi:hypothetical protein